MKALGVEGNGATGTGRNGALSAEDWIEAANLLLASENVRGVQISALCQRLGVTKGSFYWHFSGRDALLRGLLANWRRRMTVEVVSRLARVARGPLSTLRGLLSLPRRAFSEPGTSIEMSVRDWGRRDPTAREALQEVDLMRLRFFEQTFVQFGFRPAEARVRAYLAYSLMMGDSVLKQTLGDEITTEELVETAVALLSALPGQRAEGVSGRSED